MPHYHKAYNDGRVVRGCKTKQNNEMVTMAFDLKRETRKEKEEGTSGGRAHERCDRKSLILSP